MYLCPTDVFRVASEEHHLHRLVHVVQTFFARYMLYRNAPLCPPDVLRVASEGHIQMDWYMLHIMYSQCTFVSVRRCFRGQIYSQLVDETSFTISKVWYMLHTFRNVLCVSKTLIAWPVKNATSMDW